MGQVKALVSAVKATRPTSRGATTVAARVSQTSWRGGSRGNPLRTTSQHRARDPQVSQGAGPTYRCWQCGKIGHIKRVSQFKRTRAVPKGECINSPINLESHSPVGQSTIGTLKEKEAVKLKSEHTHVSEAFCQANNFQIYPLDKLVEIEGTGGTLLNT